MNPAKAKTWFLTTSWVVAASVRASSGNPIDKLDWQVPGEELIYRSCGCADSYWVAEVRSTKRPRIVKATLSCDCEKLLFFQKNEDACTRRVGKLRRFRHYEKVRTDSRAHETTKRLVQKRS